MLVLLVVGLALLAFGAVVLMRFPDRPGGKIAWHQLEVSSVGAGLPLIALGLAAVAFASTELARSGADEDTEQAATPVSVRDVESDPSAGAGAPVETGIAEECLGDYFGGIRGERVARVEEGVLDLDVIGPAEPKDEPFGLLLMRNGEPLGGIRMRFFPDGSLFKVESLVDAQCQETTAFENVSRSDSAQGVLQNWDSLGLELGGTAYELRIGASLTIRVNYFLEVA